MTILTLFWWPGKQEDFSNGGLGFCPLFKLISWIKEKIILSLKSSIKIGEGKISNEALTIRI